MPSMDLTGRCAVVTGASAGIGAAVATGLAAAGARVALLARRGEQLAELAAQIDEAGGTALAVVADVADLAALGQAVELVGRELGPVDLLVNNAGVVSLSAFERGDTEAWDRAVQVNLNGVIRTSHAFLPDLLAAADADRPADLVNVSSLGARIALPGLAVYNATKAAVSHFTDTLRAELGPRGLRVSSVEPGAVADTEIGQHVRDPVLGERIRQAVAANALAPADVADLVTYLTSRPARVNLANVLVLPTG